MLELFRGFCTFSEMRRTMSSSSGLSAYGSYSSKVKREGGAGLVATLSQMPPEKYFEEALKSCEAELVSLGPPKKFLRVIGGAGELDGQILETFGRKFNYILLDDVESFKELFLYLDSRTEAVERVLMRYGLELSIMFSLRFFEDISHLYPIEPDNTDEELKDEWDWDSLHREVLELFYDKLQGDIYELIGFSYCGPEIMLWIKDFVSDVEGKVWWQENIRCFDYTGLQ